MGNSYTKQSDHGSMRSVDSAYSACSRWEEDKRQLVDDVLNNSNNPRVINFKNYQYPVLDPVDMMVFDTE